jgi:hypothetical protein
MARRPNSSKGLQHRPQLKIFTSILANRTCQERVIQYGTEDHERVILGTWRVPAKTNVHLVTSHQTDR